MFLAQPGNIRKHADRTGDGSEGIADLVRNRSGKTPHGCEPVLHAQISL